MSSEWGVIRCLVVLGLVVQAGLVLAQGPPGGGFGGGPSSFLSRMDANGNGILEPDEMQGRARFFLERMAENIPGMSLDRPIPLSRLSEAFERMRQERFGGGGPSSRGWGGDRGGRDDRGGGSSGGWGGPSSRSGGSSGESVEPLVPGFGTDEVLDPIPGFGTGAEQFAVRIIDADYREADQTLARNDRNKDGVLDQEEIRQGRWRDDPLRQDRNGDGKLSRTELALRYAIRRVEREGGSSSTGGSSGRGSSGGSSSSTSSTRSGSTSSNSDPRLAALLQSVYERYDRNRNGVFEREEWSSFRSDPSEADTSRDGRITREEISKWLADRYLNRGGSGDSRGGWGGSRGGWSGGFGGDSRWSSFRGGDREGGGDGGGGGDGRGGGREESAGSGLKIVGKSRQGHLAYDVRSATERLPDDVPEWFRSLDANADGQVAMHEFKASWSEQDVADFAQFDLDRDGFIRAAECVSATQRGAVRGSPSASLVSASSGSSGASEGGSGGSGASSAAGSSGTEASADDRYVRYAVGFIRRYDDNGDGVLVKEEWSKMSRDYSHADTDGDGKITPLELAKAMSRS